MASCSAVATDVPWAMVFPNDIWFQLPRHPTQLYEAALEGIVFFLVLRLFTHHFHRLPFPSFISGIFCVGYGVARVFVEFFREPDVQIGFLVGGLTMGMALSIPMILFGIFLIVRARARPLATVQDA